MTAPIVLSIRIFSILSLMIAPSRFGANSMSGSGSTMLFRFNDGRLWQIFFACILPIRPRPTSPMFIFLLPTLIVYYYIIYVIRFSC